MVHPTGTRADGSHAIVMAERTMRASPEKVRVCSFGFTRLCQKIQRAALILKQQVYLHTLSNRKGNEWENRNQVHSGWELA